MSTHPRVLIVDEDPTVAAVIGRLVRRIGYTVDAVSRGADALSLQATAIARGQPYRAAVVEWSTEGTRAFEHTLRALIAGAPELGVVLLSTAMVRPGRLPHAEFGALWCLPKPFAVVDLEQALSVAAGRLSPDARSGLGG